MPLCHPGRGRHASAPTSIADSAYCAHVTSTARVRRRRLLALPPRASDVSHFDFYSVSSSLCVK
uniref:Uncharacterized protein n=1 Tax=Oryza punctata TaxID=4537 RepID=A0A0E0L0W2_ORYPU